MERTEETSIQAVHLPVSLMLFGQPPFSPFTAAYNRKAMASWQGDTAIEPRRMISGIGVGKGQRAGGIRCVCADGRPMDQVGRRFQHIDLVGSSGEIGLDAPVVQRRSNRQFTRDR